MEIGDEYCVPFELIRAVLRSIALCLCVSVVDHIRNDLAGGMVLRVADDRDSAAAFDNSFAFRDGIFGIVGTFRVNVGADRADQLFNRRFTKDGHRVNATESSDGLGTFGFCLYRSAVALKCANLLVRIDPDDEKTAEILRSGEISNVTHMQHVEAAVRENDTRPALSGRGDVLDQSISFDDRG